MKAFLLCVLTFLWLLGSACALLSIWWNCLFSPVQYFCAVSSNLGETAFVVFGQVVIIGVAYMQEASYTDDGEKKEQK